MTTSSLPEVNSKHVKFRTNSNQYNQSKSVKLPRLTMPPYLVSETKFITSVMSLIENIQLPMNIIITGFNEYKNKFISELIEQGYSQSIINKELDSSIITIMRKLYFLSMDTTKFNTINQNISIH